MVIKFPCQFCCKNMDIKKDVWERGGVVKCDWCNMSTKLRPHPKTENTEKKSKSKK